MKTLIVGLGKSGKAVYQLLAQEGEDVVGFDDNPALLKAFCKEGKKGDSHPHLQQFDRVVVSPGVAQNHPLVLEAHQKGLDIVSEVELAFQRVDLPCIGVTGTNGKTTVTLLIEHVLKIAGRSAVALGNVGIPLASYVKKAKPGDLLVVELSSYQLETLHSKKIDCGLILNITPDHLDRYPSMKEYAKAKCRLQELIKTSGSLWVHKSVEKEFGNLLTPGFQTYEKAVDPIVPIGYPLLADHDRDNILAAWIACKTFGVDPSTFSKALPTFQKPAHRIEFVTAKGGIDYFDDSKGTNIDATIKAVHAMPRQVVLIAGGVDKGASYVPWKTEFANKVKHIVALGQAAKQIACDLAPEFNVEVVADMKEAVEKASQKAQPGDAVLLSPGCSSFDMFRDYAERGEKFKQFVLER